MLQPNQRLGEFRIIRLLGKGGMGQVYEAQQTNPQRRVAVKVLAPWLAEDEEALQRFWREAGVPARLDHPAIVRIISTGKTDDGIAYYSMQLVRGISLGGLIRYCRDPLRETREVPTTADGAEPSDAETVGGPEDRLPCGEPPPAALTAYQQQRYHFAARVAAVAARALAHAHQQGFLHRDIKPSNLMIDHHDQLYLVDFGLTRTLTPGAAATHHGAVRGTPWYMSPEQARGEPVDARSDIYSLGVTLYELVTLGRGPFTASRDNSEAVLAQVRAGHWQPVRALAPDVPWPLEQIIQRAMHYRPSRRYQYAAELAADLEAVAAQSASTLSRTPPGGWEWLRPYARSAWLTGAALMLLALLVAGWLWLWPPGGAAEPDPLPESVSLEDYFRRERPPDVSTPLLRRDNQPVKARLLLGAGTYAGVAGALTVTSPKDGQPTVIGLDHPPGDYEFSVELRQAVGITPNQNDLGIVFGWRGAGGDAQAARRCFTAQLDERGIDKDAHGRVTLGTARWLARQGARGGVNAALQPLPKGRGLLPLGESPEGAGGWRSLLVRVSGGRVKVVADGAAGEEFDLDWLARNSKPFAESGLDGRGAVGVWVRNGVGSFRKATILPLPPR